MKEDEKITYAEYLSVVEELYKMKSRGVALYLNGSEKEPEHIARACIMNDKNSYVSRLNFWYNEQ